MTCPVQLNDRRLSASNWPRDMDGVQAEADARVIELLRQIAEAPSTELVVRLVREVRRRGLRRLATPASRAMAMDAMRLNAPDPAAAHCLDRIADGGRATAVPYERYLGTGLLRNWAPTESPDRILRAVARACAERVELLLALPELEQHERRTDLESAALRAVDCYRRLGFGRSAVLGPDADLMEASILPVSSNPDELIFIVCTQVCETCFQGAADILAQAVDHVVFAEAAQAASALRLAARTFGLLQLAGGLLRPMTLESWLALRDYIVEPSAIQSASYRAISGHVANLLRTLLHDRYPEWERPHACEIGAGLADFIDALLRWESLHLGLARKYGQALRSDELPMPLRYLEDQIVAAKRATDELRTRYALSDHATVAFIQGAISR